MSSRFKNKCATSKMFVKSRWSSYECLFLLPESSVQILNRFVKFLFSRRIHQRGFSFVTKLIEIDTLLSPKNNFLFFFYKKKEKIL